MLRVFKKAGQAETNDFMDYCYVADTAENAEDTPLNDVLAFESFVRVRQIDYIQFRNMCKAHLLPEWDSLMEEQHRILVRHNIAPTEEAKLMYYSQQQQLENFYGIVNAEIEARQERWNEAMITAAFMLQEIPKRLEMYNDVYGFKDKYIDADLPHIIMWLQSGIYLSLGINYSLTGFRAKSYYDPLIEQATLKILTK